ncbi:hypothetical protein GCM10022289_47020 [Pedobacter jeongneungensis]|uniref:Phage tail-like protein n=1 Tax=Pedobacter jeongneungensis TaxID=947309 RepID=A0ABP8BR39_9SPHI
MAAKGSAQDNTWPMPKFRFEVDFGTILTGVSFQEVSGLEVETEVIDYRQGNNAAFSVKKMPGLVKFGNVIMKRGVFLNDHAFWKWHEEVRMNTIKTMTVLVKLLDENGNTTMQWQLDKAWPAKMSSTDLKSDASEVSIDTLELAHEQLKVVNGR